MLLHTPGILNPVFLSSNSHVMLVKSIQSSNLNKHVKKYDITYAIILKKSR